jgi:DNA mismatch repair protein MutS
MSDNLTPMMQQYQRIKKEIPSDAVLLFRLGDFYEMFFDDAKAGSQILNLTLTKRNGIPMCGMPYHAAQNYIAKLIQTGRRVAVCDQVSEPKPGQVVDRQVTQIFSPGSVLNLELDPPKENRFLAAVHHREGAFGLAFLDMGTGDFRVVEVATLRNFQDELIRLMPKEIIIAAEGKRPPLPEGLNAVVTSYDDWVFETDFATLTLKDHFKVHSLDGFGCQGLSVGVGAAGALLHYVVEGLRGSAAHILQIKPYQAGEYLVIDAITQRNLELVHGASGAATDTSLLKAMDQTVTPMGGRELRTWLLHPLRDRERIEARQKVVAEWLTDIGRLEDFRESLREVRDLERLIGRLAQGSGTARDLLALKHSLEHLPRLREVAGSLPVPLAVSLAEQLEPLPEVVARIESAIEADPPLGLKEGGLIRHGFHPDLDELHNAQREGKTWLAELQSREQARTGIASLKVRFNQVFGYYIEITKTHLAKVPDDYIRKQTMVNAERFITPELKEMEGKILGAEERGRALEYEIFLQIRDEVVAHTGTIQRIARALAQLDVLAGLATLARRQNYQRPLISGEGKFLLVEGRHPVLEQIQAQERFVPNDLSMNSTDSRLHLITGPNMAGKSTYIRQVALIALMAHTGSYVPAQEATVPVFDRIFTRVGASDDLSRGQSTFMVEMNETANILNNATRESLIILDEIGRGTSTFDGLSIAWAVAEFLHNEVKAKTLFATHYHELTELALSMTGVKNFNVAVREWHDQIIFLRKILPGSADKSYGIQVARLAGLPKPVLDRAKSILRNLEENGLDATGRPTRVLEEKRGKPRRKRRTGGKKGKKKLEQPQFTFLRMFDGEAPAS